MSTITSFLMADRMLCERLFQRADSAVRRRSWMMASFAIVRFGRALNKHLAMEEAVVFKALEQYTSDARKPVAAMLLEHRRLRQFADSAATAIRRRKARDFMSAASSLRLMMQEHSAKEEGIVLRMADHLLRPAARFLVEAMQSLEMRAGMGRSEARAACMA